MLLTLPIPRTSVTFLTKAVLPLVINSCGGYDAANPKDLTPRVGEIVGVLVDKKGTCHPDAWIELYRMDSNEPVSQSQGIDSDGRFGVFPPDSGSFNIVGSFGEPATSTEKAIIQGITFTIGEGRNIGKLTGAAVAGLTASVKTPANIDKGGIVVSVMGYAGTAVTNSEGIAVVAMGIPAGTYKVNFSGTGVQDRIVGDVVLSAGEVKLLENVELDSNE